MDKSAVELLEIEAEADAPVALDFRRLFEREFDYVSTALRRLGVAERDVEDVVHEVFLRVLHRLDQYEPTRPLRPWLFGFAFRLASDYRRRAGHKRELLADGEEPNDLAPNQLDRLIEAEQLELAREALDALELKRRAVFILHELDGFSLKEVATSLGIPLGTAHSRLRLARAEFTAIARRLLLRRGTG